MRRAAAVPGRAHAVGLALLLTGWPHLVSAQSVSLQGMLGGKALLIVDGGAPKMVAPGDSYQGVTVVSTRGDRAVVDVGGRRLTLRVGETPASVGGPGAKGGSGRIVLSANEGGHFFAEGTINGRSARFLVDTGATVVSLSAADAERVGLNYRSGPPVQMNTANGPTQGWLLRLASMRVGDVELRDVDAVVTPQPMPYVLLGNSFLDRFRMKRDGAQMTLDRRY